MWLECSFGADHPYRGDSGIRCENEDDAADCGTGPGSRARASVMEGSFWRVEEFAEPGIFVSSPPNLRASNEAE